jgi:hypothetical protein
MLSPEAFTTTAAEQVIDHLVNACGLRLAPEAQRPSTAHQAEGSSALHDALEPGRIVFVYRQARDSGHGVRDSGEELRDSKAVGAAHPTPSSSDQSAAHKLAA